MHGLYLFNYDRSRWLFTTTHLAESIEPTAEVMHLPRNVVETADLGPLANVDYIAVLNQAQSTLWQFRYTKDERLALDARLSATGFERVAETVPSQNELWLYLRANNQTP